MIVLKQLAHNTFEATDVFDGMRGTAETAEEAYALVKNTQAVRNFAHMRLRAIRKISTVQFDPRERMYVGECPRAGIRVLAFTRSDAWDALLADFVRKDLEARDAPKGTAQAVDMDARFEADIDPETQTEENE